MKQFLAVFTGSPDGANADKWNALTESERKSKVQEGGQAWGQWMQKNKSALVFPGAPLGKTIQVGPGGAKAIRNQMSAYVVVQAETHEAAAQMFEKHPHFMIFPGDGVEIMECLPVPQT